MKRADFLKAVAGIPFLTALPAPVPAEELADDDHQYEVPAWLPCPAPPSEGMWNLRLTQTIDLGWVRAGDRHIPNVVKFHHWPGEYEYHYDRKEVALWPAEKWWGKNLKAEWVPRPVGFLGVR